MTFPVTGIILSFQENVVVFNELKDKRLHRSSIFACVYSTPNGTGVMNYFYSSTEIGEADRISGQ